LINPKDVVRIKVPYPDISSELAVTTHMYICHCTSGNTVKFVKCQTLKPYMLLNSPIKHYWDESPDISRNPFKNETRIDCDKEFVTYGVTYDDRLKTTTRPDVCEDIMSHVLSELFSDGYDTNDINESELCLLNRLVTAVV